MWDQRYANEEFAYGTSPNEFLVEALPPGMKGKALCLAEGEGRNAVFLAERGFEVLAVDQSPVGLLKAQQLAKSRGVQIQTTACDLGEFAFENDRWDLIVSIWGHLPRGLREQVHGGVAGGLRSGGLYILEAYHPRNVGRGTGGPQDPELCVQAADLRKELSQLEVVHLLEHEREVNEGVYHRGLAAVTQAVFRRS